MRRCTLPSTAPPLASEAHGEERKAVFSHVKQRQLSTSAVGELAQRKIALSEVLGTVHVFDGAQHVGMTFSEALGNLHAVSGWFVA